MRKLGSDFRAAVLGYFGAGADIIRATVELKSPGTNLDAPQGGGYGPVSPVEQAFRASAGSAASWVVVSNFDEIRLYHADDPSRANVIKLSDVTTVETARRALALLDRRSLLGGATPSSTAIESSPLERLRAGGRPSMLNAQEPSIRLLQECYLVASDANIPFHLLDDGLQEALARGQRYAGYPRWPQCSGPPYEFLLDLDRLVLSTPDPEDASRELSRFEFSKNGVLRSWEAVFDRDDSGTRLAACNAEELARRVALFVLLCRTAFQHAANTSEVAFRWRLYDLKTGVSCHTPATWLGTTGETRRLQIHRDQPVAMASAGHDLRLDRLSGANNLAHLVTPVVRELLYPFEYRSVAVTRRVAPNDHDMGLTLQEVLKLC